MTNTDIIFTIEKLSNLIITLDHTKVEGYKETQKESLKKINELISRITL